MFPTLPAVARGVGPKVKASGLANDLTILANMPTTARVEKQPDLFGYQPWSSSNFTDEEVFRMTGTLPAERIEALLDHSAQLKQLTNIDGHIDDAMAQFPAEDFLSDLKQEMYELAKRLRGDNKEALTNLCAMLDDRLQTQFYATEYGTNELFKANKILAGAGLARAYKEPGKPDAKQHTR